MIAQGQVLDSLEEANFHLVSWEVYQGHGDKGRKKEPSAHTL